MYAQPGAGGEAGAGAGDAAGAGAGAGGAAGGGDDVIDAEFSDSEPKP
jgi:hypothetical protein